MKNKLFFIFYYLCFPMRIVLQNEILRKASKRGLMAAFLLLIAQVVPYIEKFQLLSYLQVPITEDVQNVLLYGPDILRMVGYLLLLYCFSAFMYSFKVYDDEDTRVPQLAHKARNPNKDIKQAFVQAQTPQELSLDDEEEKDAPGEKKK